MATLRSSIGNGVALAMSTERDTVVRISYPDQVSWLTRRRTFPLLDHRRTVAARDRGTAVDTAARVPPPARQRAD